MNNVDLGNQYKKIIQFFWDPEPKNDDSGQPIWCLGCEYRQAETPGPAQSSGEPADTTNRDREPTTLTSTPKTTASTTTTTTTTTDTTEKEKRTSTDGPPTPGSAISSFVNLASPISSSSTAESSVTPAWPPQFLDDFESKLWITYRSQFPPIPKTPKTGSGDSSSSISLGVRLRSQLIDTQGFTSDTGWGCMIRSGQALLANTLLFLRLGRDWRRGSKVQEESELVSLFADHPRAPFSIHRFVHHGATACGKCPGEWFGPSAASQCIQALVKSNPQVGLRVCITSDGSDIYEKQFKEVACDESGGGIQPTLILLGVRLGIDRVTPVYWDSLKALLRFPQSVGIAGGRPSSSHYFIATQGDSFFYLDPHQTRPCLTPRAESTGDEESHPYSPEELSTYHTRRLRRLHVREMDPSMLIGFLVRDEDDWEDLKQRVREGSSRGKIIHVFDRDPTIKETEREGAEEEVESFDEI